MRTRCAHARQHRERLARPANPSAPPTEHVLNGMWSTRVHACAVADRYQFPEITLRRAAEQTLRSMRSRGAPARYDPTPVSDRHARVVLAEHSEVREERSKSKEDLKRVGRLLAGKGLLG